MPQDNFKIHFEWFVDLLTQATQRIEAEYSQLPKHPKMKHPPNRIHQPHQGTL